MGPQVKSVERTSQATPFANDFLKYLQGQLSGAFQTPTGSAGMTPGQSPQQYTNFQQKVGGINTTGELTNAAPALIDALTARSQATTDRSAAQLREGHGALGNRFGSSLTRGEGLLRSEAGLNLDQLIAGVLLEQAGREQAARQFDVMANLEAVAPFFQMAGMGIIPNEIIASPGIGSQLLSGGLSALGSFFGAGGSLGLGKLFGGGGNAPTFPGGVPSGGGGTFVLPNPGKDPFTRYG